MAWIHCIAAIEKPLRHQLWQQPFLRTAIELSTETRATKKFPMKFTERIGLVSMKTANAKC